MKIYTRTGDSGSTGLFGGQRVEKDSAAVEAYGCVDELNACLGLARVAVGAGRTDEWLGAIQSELLTLGAELACVPGHEARLGIELLGAAATARLEGHIDAAELELEPLRQFILPGGSPAAAALHHARTVCRRAERRVVTARRDRPVRDELVRYLNRLGDLLFVLARHQNHLAGVGDVRWEPRS